MLEDHHFRLKVHCMCHGIRLTSAAIDVLSNSGTVPITIHEYATTGGVTLRIDDMYLNAPFDDWYCDSSRAVLDVDESRQFHVEYDGVVTRCEVLPLPGYLEATNALGHPVARTTMSHCDRIRVSPISGCTLDCAFCDLPALRYRRHEADEILASIEVAKADTQLPPHHLLISGGSPGPAHFDWFDETLVKVIEGCGLPTDVMMSPREGNLDHVRRFADAGAVGFSLNLEVFGDARATEIMPRKHQRSSPHMARTVEAAVAAVGGQGAVRSIVIIGLEGVEDTLAAIEFLAGLGADPVLSPFRPARGTLLETWSPPSEKYLLEVFREAQKIARRHGVELGPRCIPCQHNTLTMPDPGIHWYSQATAVSGRA